MSMSAFYISSPFGYLAVIPRDLMRNRSINKPRPPFHVIILLQSRLRPRVTHVSLKRKKHGRDNPRSNTLVRNPFDCFRFIVISHWEVGIFFLESLSMPSFWSLLGVSSFALPSIFLLLIFSLQERVPTVIFFLPHVLRFEEVSSLAKKRGKWGWGGGFTCLAVDFAVIFPIASYILRFPYLIIRVQGVAIDLLIDSMYQGLSLSRAEERLLLSCCVFLLLFSVGVYGLYTSYPSLI
mmetsp:Transcript_8389/g.13116  ORF Transcript_8389/g.13116 Transcript_8389/m.13116 type:complete len:237 (-) Transcript_8389:1362-2072(-)